MNTTNSTRSSPVVHIFTVKLQTHVSRIHSPTERAVRHQHGDSAPGHDFERDTRGPTPIGDYLPRLRLRVRTFPTLVWRDGASCVEWIVVSYPELIHTASRHLSNPTTDSGRRA